MTNTIVSEDSLGDIVAPGDIVAGKYRVERVIGTGGMGVVVEAWHIHFEERVAIKFLLPQMGANEEAVGRFEREAKAAFKIKSEHVTRVIDVGKLDGSAPYMVMEYLEGTDLGERLTNREAFPIPSAIDFVLQAAEAVGEAHTLGIVHRDLKPENLFLTRRADGSACIKVLDFGLSKVDDTSGQKVRERALTGTKQVMGTPQYMSPEQWMSSKDVGPASDQWALGVILFELITGHQPFDQEHIAQLCTQVLRGEPTPLLALRPEVPQDLVAAIMRCMEKEPTKRYAHVAAMAHALHRFGSASARASAKRLAGIFRSAGFPVDEVDDEVPTGGLGRGMVLGAGTRKPAPTKPRPHVPRSSPPRPSPPRPSGSGSPPNSSRSAPPRPSAPGPSSGARPPRPGRPSSDDEHTLVQFEPPHGAPAEPAAAAAKAAEPPDDNGEGPTAIFAHPVSVPQDVADRMDEMLREEPSHETAPFPIGLFASSAATSAGPAPPPPPAPSPAGVVNQAAVRTLALEDGFNEISGRHPAVSVPGAAAGAPARPRRSVTAQSWQHMLEVPPSNGKKKVVAALVAIVTVTILVVVLLVSPSGAPERVQPMPDLPHPAVAPEDIEEPEEEVEAVEEETSPSASPTASASGAAEAGKKLPPAPVPRKHSPRPTSIFDRR
ncbi:MAG: serine/threonine-protein kinase [Polyangiaceae bacterium]